MFKFFKVQFMPYLGPQYAQRWGMHMPKGSRMHASGQQLSTGQESEIILHHTKFNITFQNVFRSPILAPIYPKMRVQHILNGTSMNGSAFGFEKSKPG